MCSRCRDQSASWLRDVANGVFRYPLSLIATHWQSNLVEITRSWSLLRGILHGPCNKHSALTKKKKERKEEEKNPHHPWWELRNIAASGMFPRWLVGSDGGCCGFLERFMGNLMHTYRVSWWNVSCVLLNLELLLFWIQILWFHFNFKRNQWVRLVNVIISGACLLLISLTTQISRLNFTFST